MPQVNTKIEQLYINTHQARDLANAAIAQECENLELKGDPPTVSYELREELQRTGYYAFGVTRKVFNRDGKRTHYSRWIFVSKQPGGEVSIEEPDQAKLSQL